MPTLPTPPARARLLAAASLWLLPLAAAGCADERLDAELTSALYAAPVPAAADAPTVDAGPLPDRVEEVGPGHLVFSAGAPDGDERYLFGRIADVAASATGDTLFVLDRMQRQVRAFSREGRYLYHFGGHGRGPGEYEDPVSLALLPATGELAVWDLGLQRLTVATPAGETVHTALPLRQSEMARQGKKLRAGRGGLLLELNDDPLVTAPERQRGRLVRMDARGALRDTVLEFAIPPIFGSHQQRGGELVSAHWVYSPTWTPDPEWDVGADGSLVLAPGGRYEAFRFAAADGAALRVVRPWTARTVTRAERALNLREEQARGMYGAGIPVWLLERINRERYARVRPALTGVLALPDGGLAVRRFSTEDDWQGLGRTWDEYGPDGRARRSVRYPAGFEPRLVTADRVVGLRRDSLDVDYLEAYRR